MIDLDVSERVCDDLIGHGLGYLPPAGIGNSVSIKEIIARLRQAEKDAARYRWLRDESYQAEGVSPACFVISDGELAVDGNGYHGMLVTDGLDSAVDEAMQCSK